jgi:hypothetical protein
MSGIRAVKWDLEKSWGEFPNEAKSPQGSQKAVINRANGKKRRPTVLNQKTNYAASSSMYSPGLTWTFVCE